MFTTKKMNTVPEFEVRNSKNYLTSLDHPKFRKDALGVERPFAELSESSGVFSEQLSKFEIPFSEYEIPFSELHPTTWAIRAPQFSEQLPERFPELMGTHMKDFHLPLHSRSVFARMGVVPTRKITYTRTLRAQILKIFNLAWNFQSRLKISISLENSLPGTRWGPKNSLSSVFETVLSETVCGPFPTHWKSKCPFTKYLFASLPLLGEASWTI